MDTVENISVVGNSLHQHTSIVDDAPKLKPASDEQLKIIEAVVDHNVLVDSVAGSGKTTTILHIAAKYTEYRMLVLTYNRKLRLETMGRAGSLGLRITVHTYHSFAYRHIGPHCFTDSGIIEYINSGQELICDKYDIIVIDEAQDMTEIYYKLARMIVQISLKARLVIIGDNFQSIYGFAGADPRFITMADKLYITKHPWMKLGLNTSYRVTRQIAAFVNYALGCERMYAVKDGPMPDYVIYNGFEDAEQIVDAVKKLISGGARPSDIFILAPSVRGKKTYHIVGADTSRAAPRERESPIKKVANALSRSGLLVYVPTNDDQKLDDKLTNHKIVFSSFHQSKGLERDHVIVLNFDHSYAQFYNKDDPLCNRYCSNAMYVALTRARKSLSVYHNCGDKPLDYIKLEELGRVANIVVVTRTDPKHSQTKQQPLRVTNLTRQISTKILMACSGLLKHEMRRKGHSLRLHSDSQQMATARTGGYEAMVGDAPGDQHTNGVVIVSDTHHTSDSMSAPRTVNEVLYHEEVATINGMAVTMWCEFHYTGRVTVYESDSKAYTVSLPYNIDAYHCVDNPPKVSDILRLANYSMSHCDQLVFRMRQIRQYNWLPDVVFSELATRMVAEIGDMRPPPDADGTFIENARGSNIEPVRCKFEHYIEVEAFSYTLRGAVDIIVEDRVYEIKTVEEVSAEHFMQLALYAFMMKISGDEETFGVKYYLLYNVRNDELYRLTMSFSDLEQVVKLLICNKEHPKAVSDDKTFLSNLGIQGVNIARACGRCVELGW